MNRPASPPPQPAWSRGELALLAAIVAAGLLLRAAAAILIPSPLESDYLGYWRMANGLYAGTGMDDGTGMKAFLNIGYPIFIGAVFTVFGTTITAAKCANVLLGGATIALAYLAARRLFASRHAAAWAAILVAAYLEAVIYAAYMAKENLLNALVMAQLALVARPPGRLGWFWHAVLFGFLTGCVAVVGNAGLVLLPGLVLQLYFLLGTKAATARHVAVTLAAVFLVIAPVLWRNQNALGHAVLNTNGGVNLYIGNNPNARPYYSNLSDTPMGPDWLQERRRLGEFEWDVMLRRLAVAYILEHPLETVQLALRKGVAFWIPPTHSGKYEQGRAETLLRLVWLIQFCAIGALFLLASTQMRRHGRAIAVLWLLVLGYTGVHMIFYVVYRYRLPIMPVLCLGAGMGLDLVLSRTGLGRRRPA